MEQRRKKMDMLIKLNIPFIISNRKRNKANGEKNYGNYVTYLSHYTILLG